MIQRASGNIFLSLSQKKHKVIMGNEDELSITLYQMEKLMKTKVNLCQLYRSG